MVKMRLEVSGMWWKADWEYLIPVSFGFTYQPNNRVSYWKFGELWIADNSKLRRDILGAYVIIINSRSGAYTVGIAPLGGSLQLY